MIGQTLWYRIFSKQNELISKNIPQTLSRNQSTKFILVSYSPENKCAVTSFSSHNFTLWHSAEICGGANGVPCAVSHISIIKIWIVPCHFVSSIPFFTVNFARVPDTFYVITKQLFIICFPSTTLDDSNCHHSLEIVIQSSKYYVMVECWSKDIFETVRCGLAVSCWDLLEKW